MNKKDKIKISNLEIFAKHGVYPEENVLGQKFVVSAVLYVSTYEAGHSDDLKDSVNYGEVCHFIKDFAEGRTYKLLESLAENMADALLNSFCQVEQVDIEIKKPWAPIGLHFDSVAVEISRKWHRVYVAMGSNMGDRKAYLDEAVRAIDETEGCVVLKVADYVETKPYGNVEQDDFMNSVFELATLLPPEKLLKRLNEIEAEAGRTRDIHWGPRTLDLDIIFYDDVVMDTPELTIPHADMHNRNFVLGPLAQIAPYIRHPLLGKTVKNMFENDCK